MFTYYSATTILTDFGAFPFLVSLLLNRFLFLVLTGDEFY